VRHLSDRHGALAATSDATTRHEGVLPGLQDAPCGCLGRDFDVLESEVCQRKRLPTM
jgi:hypothetical protein